MHHRSNRETVPIHSNRGFEGADDNFQTLKNLCCEVALETDTSQNLCGQELLAD